MRTRRNPDASMERGWYGLGTAKVRFCPDVIGNFESPKFGKVDSPIINNLMKVYSVVLFFLLLKIVFLFSIRQPVPDSLTTSLFIEKSVE
jgi:hypothetical protein